MDKQTRLCPECGKEGWLEVADTRAATHHQQEMLKRLDGVEVLEKFLRNLQQSTGVSLMKDFAEDVFTEIKKLLAEG